MLARKKAITCKLCDETGGILLIILWMSYFLRPHSIGLLTAAKTVSSQKKGQNLTSFIAQFTDGETHMADSSRPIRPADEIYDVKLRYWGKSFTSPLLFRFHHKAGVEKRHRGCYCEQKSQEESQEDLSCKSQYP